MKLALLLLMLISSNLYAAQVALPNGYSLEPVCDFNSICIKEQVWDLRQNNDYEAIQKIVAKWAKYNQGWLNRLEYVMQDVVLFTIYKMDYGMTEVLLIKNKDGVWVPTKESHATF